MGNVMPLSPRLKRNRKLIFWYQRWVEFFDQKCFKVTGTAPYNGYRVAGKRLMTLQEIQNQALLLPTGDRWQLVQVLLESLKREASPKPKQGNLSRLRGIAKISAAIGETNAQEDYVTYLTEKYQ
jgi:hypothetical protein